MSTRNANGEGSIYRRADGRYVGAIYVTTVSGVRKRLNVYGATRVAAHQKLLAAKVQEQEGIPVPDRTWTLGAYLDYWLHEVVAPTRRATTYARYELVVRLYLKPNLGKTTLIRLSVAHVQTFVNDQLAAGASIRNVQIMREVLRAALSRAVREELLVRNVARLVELPKWERGDIQPWTADEAKHFLKAAETDPLYPAFLLLVIYGLRRGEVLGVRWSDIDLRQGVLHVRQQVQRIGGDLQALPLKTKSGRRDLPLVPLLTRSLSAKPATDPDDFVFATSTGRPIEPRNFVRSFHRIREQHGLRRIRVHDVRHTAATMLKRLGIPARDAQLILGHSTVQITQEIYQHDDMDSRVDALSRVEKVYLRVADGARSCQTLLSKANVVALLTTSIPGRGDRIRTCDTRFWRSIDEGLTCRLLSVRETAESRTRLWLCGAVAVSAAVNVTAKSVPEIHSPATCPRCGYDLEEVAA
jgi:integrase